MVRPSRSSNPKNWPSRGLRRSQETSTTRWPAWANIAPRLDSVEVLPSAAAGLVTRIVRRSRSCRANCSEVRSDRYASAAGDIGRASDTTSGRSRFFHEVTIGTAASTVAPAELLGRLLGRHRVVEALPQERRGQAQDQAGRPGRAGRPRSAWASWAKRRLGGRDHRQAAGLAGAVDLHLGELLAEHGLLVDQRGLLRGGAWRAAQLLDLLADRPDLARSWASAAVRLLSAAVCWSLTNASA